jgi:hypothetical protein
MIPSSRAASRIGLPVLAPDAGLARGSRVRPPWNLRLMSRKELAQITAALASAQGSGIRPPRNPTSTERPRDGARLERLVETQRLLETFAASATVPLGSPIGSASTPRASRTGHEGAECRDRRRWQSCGRWCGECSASSDPDTASSATSRSSSSRTGSTSASNR